jgi:hypothetical protein
MMNLMQGAAFMTGLFLSHFDTLWKTKYLANLQTFHEFCDPHRNIRKQDRPLELYDYIINKSLTFFDA